MIDRRAVIGTIGGLATVSCVPHRAENPTPKPKENIVLVHGAWHGGWCWRDVARFLRAASYRVFTPTMTGLGERVHLNSRDIDLSTHVQDIINLIRFEELDNITLVGHSYAGYIVTLLADALKEKLNHIVYLDALLPTRGEALVPKAQQESLTEQFKKTYTFPPGSFEFLGIPEDHPDAEWVRRHLTAHPLGTFFEPVQFENEGAKGISKTFIRCTGNPLHKEGDPVLEQTRDDPEWKYLLIDTGHDAMVTEPELLANMLMQEIVTHG